MATPIEEKLKDILNRLEDIGMVLEEYAMALDVDRENEYDAIMLAAGLAIQAMAPVYGVLKAERRLSVKG